MMIGPEQRRGWADIVRDSDWEILAELGHNPNISRAAAKLFMSQPALTKRLQRIEAELGVAVAMRSGRGLELTDEGVYLCERGGEHVRFIEETHRHLAEMHDSSTIALRVGSSYSFNKYHLWDVLDGYEISTGKNVRFDVVNEQSDVLVTRVMEGNLDFAFEQGEFPGGLRRACVRHTPAYLVTACPVDLRDILKMDRITYRSSAPSIALLDTWWEQTFGSKIPAGSGVGYIGFALDLVARGEGFSLAFLPDSFQNSQGLTLVPLVMPDGNPVVRSTYCVWAPGELTPTLASFIRYIEDEVALPQ